MVTPSKIIQIPSSERTVEYTDVGSGPVIVYLHGVIKSQTDPLIDELSKSHRIVAPFLPGYGSSTGGSGLNSVHDAALHLDETLDHLGISNAVLVGHSLGGLLAGELAAVSPRLFSHIIFIASYGLWSDDEPTMDFFTASPQEMSKAFYSDSSLPGAINLSQSPSEEATEVDPNTEDGMKIIKRLVEQAKTMSSAARYLWPIPDRGLADRMYRIRIPSLVIWGENDGIIPLSYADLFARNLPDSEKVLFPDAAHMLNEEYPQQLAHVILDFIS